MYANPLRKGYDGQGGRALRLGETWEVTAWEIKHLESCPFGIILGKLPLGKKPLGKHLTLPGTTPRTYCIFF